MVTSEPRLPWRHRPLPELIRLAWPIAVSMLSYSAMTLTDTLFVGRLGASALAGVGVGGVFTFTLLCFGFGLLRSVKVLTSQTNGAEREGEARERRLQALLGAGVWVALGVGLAGLVLGLVLVPLLPLVTASETSGGHARVYASIRLLGMPLALVGIAFKESRYGRGDAQRPMVASLVANVVNIALDYGLIVGAGLGVAGAAWASVIAQGVEAAQLTWHDRGVLRHLARVPRSDLGAVWRLGWPLGVQMLLEVCAFALLTALFAGLSDLDVAAHQIVIQVAHFSFLPAFALGEAASILVGQAVGANEDGLVRVVARRALALSLAYTGLCGLVFVLGAEPIARAFTGIPDLVALVVTLLYIAGAFQLFDGALITARCVLRGTGDVRYPAVVAVAAAWLATPPVTLVLGYGLGLGVVGGWIGICLEIMLGAAILWRRLERGHWAEAAARSRAELSAVSAATRRLVAAPGDPPSRPGPVPVAG